MVKVTVKMTLKKITNVLLKALLKMVFMNTAKSPAKSAMAFLPFGWSFMAIMAPMASLGAQTSLWQDKSLFVEHYETGDVLRIDIDESFELVSKGDYNRNLDSSYESNPPRNYFRMMLKSQSNKTAERNSKVRQEVAETYRFQLNGVLGEAQGNLYQISGAKTIVFDGKSTQIQLIGQIDLGRIRNGIVHSADILDMTLIIITEPPPRLAEQALFETAPAKGEESTAVVRDTGENNGAEENSAAQGSRQGLLPGGAGAGLTEEAQKQIQLEYLREILGAIQ